MLNGFSFYCQIKKKLDNNNFIYVGTLLGAIKMLKYKNDVPYV